MEVIRKIAGSEHYAMYSREPDGCWTGYVLNLPITMATGSTLEASEADIRISYSLWLEKRARCAMRASHRKLEALRGVA